jgi:magnesium transporter
MPAETFKSIIQGQNSTTPEIVFVGQENFRTDSLIEVFNRLDIAELDREDVFSDTQLSKIEFRRDYIYIALQFPDFDKTKKTFVEKEVHCFVSNNYLLLINKEGYNAIKCFRNIGSLDIDKNTTFDLFYEILWKGLNDSYRSMVKLKIQVQRLNQKIFEEQSRDRDLILDIQSSKRNLVNFEGVIEPLSEVLQIIEMKHHQLIDIEDKEEIDNCLDLVKKMLNNINNLKQQMQIVAETNEVIITRNTNDIVKRLTGISILVLVPSTITGFFSMNMYYGFSTTAKWPALTVVFCVLFFTAVVFVILKRKRLI